jgi:hypothetical protein
MKIDVNSEITKTTHQALTNKPTPTEKNQFQEILQRTIGDPPKSVSTPKEPAGIMTVPELGFKGLVTIEEGKATERVEAFFDTIDTYRKKLGNPKNTLRDIAPVIKQMEEQIEKLQQSMDLLPAGSGLKEILNRASVIASVEISRFNQGDYVDAF